MAFLFGHLVDGLILLLLVIFDYCG